MHYKTFITFMLISFNSFAQNIHIPEETKEDASNLIKSVETRYNKNQTQEVPMPIDNNSRESASELIRNIQSNKNYEEEVQRIIDKTENIKKQVNKTYSKDINEINIKTEQARQSKTFKETHNWIKNNQDKIFDRQERIIADLASKEDPQNNNIVNLLKNYHFKPNDVKTSSITHYPVMIFVSSSIPNNSLKDLMIQAKKVGAVLVFRGFIGSLKNTQEFLANIAKENVSAIIDPRLFDIFQVKLVPTFIVLANNIQNCEANNCNFTPKNDRISGNITLKYALEQIENSKSDSSTIASKYLKNLNQETN